MKEHTLKDIKLDTEMTYFVGTNAQDNWDLISASNPNDIWFHLQNVSSCHVVLKMNDLTLEQLSKQTILHCASKCKASKHANLNMNVIYTEIKNISKAQVVGSVYVKNERIISV